MFLKSLKPRNNWEILTFSISNKVWSKELFQTIYLQFTNSVSSKFTDSNHMYILFKIKYNTNEIITIGTLQRINLNDLNWYSNWIIKNMLIKSDDYNETGILELIFSFGFKNEVIQDKPKFNENFKLQTINNLKLPISYNILDFGKLIKTNKFENYKEHIIGHKDNLFIIKEFNSYNEIELFKDNDLLIKWIDKFIDTNSFERFINNQTFVFKDNILVLSTKDLKTSYITKLNKSKNLNNNFITLDIETYIKGNILIPYLICFYDGQESKSFYLSDYNCIDELMNDLFENLFRRKYNFQNIYVHNLANFDIIFLLKYLVKFGEVKPIIRNNKFISINIVTDKGYSFTFKDSLQMILGSLRDLGKSFNVSDQKGNFDFTSVNENNLIKFKKDSTNYCILDCISLHQIISKFAKFIFDLFSVNIHRYPTLSSLAFAIFRSNFMKNENIPRLGRKHVEVIRSGYTGGALDMYIPESKEGELVYHYDVNSLYPDNMLKNKMPVGNVKFFSGNILDINPNAFGFFFCKIEAPENIKHPILQTHVLTDAGNRTMAPIGTWTDFIFSEEMRNAQKYGYKFEILEGYLFESDYIFEDYVTFLFNLRSKYPKSDPLNFISKLLLNSLYGRFGMEDNYPLIDIIPNEYYQDFWDKKSDNILSELDLGENKLIIHSNSNLGENTGNVSIGVAFAITAYARIYMTYYKNNNDFILYYSDTDSAFTNKPLKNELIGNELGKMKLENICKKVIFLSPKTYCLLTENNKFIYKVKGLKSEVKLTLNDFKNLLIKDSSLQKSQIKWRRSLTNAQIALINEIYTLKVNDNKRKLIYNKNNKLIGTISYKIDNNKTIINND